MQFKEGLGWKACYDEERGIYTAERRWRGFYQLCEIDRATFEKLGTDTTEDESPDELIANGRHLFEANDDYDTAAPTATVYDEDYYRLAPWSGAKRRAEKSSVTSQELTDFMVEHFSDEEKNRRHREQLKA